MDYRKFSPSENLSSFINCFWTLEITADKNAAKQRIVPDGCIELAFILGDDIKRYTSEHEYILQPRAMVLGQTVSPFYIQPTGYVQTFAASFFPYAFSHFISEPIKNLKNQETSIYELFKHDEATKLESDIIQARNTSQRIEILEAFLLHKLSDPQRIEHIVKTTVDIIFAQNGDISVNAITKSNLNNRRQLERKFLDLVGISPKHLSKLVRLQSALTLLINREDNLTNIAYKSNYYDQSHFIKDFKALTGVSPRAFLDDESMTLSRLFYK
ncbi:response regulator transcription factor [Pseudoalteromonas sp. S2755]|uniref:response regulator transcription factor n=1 Tax=Pseudoalteromonas sp. S2755 TaxID=2066523 RepID=UPI00110B1E3D|nr:response regulator transcription factor [Pseudoalteromonas sp. S2755]TMN33668.1 AraC family transcriptional regulator [Pseudoalteromonas sp. S2755]